MGGSPHRPADFANFVNRDFDWLSRRYQDISHASTTTYAPGLEAVFFNAHNGFTLPLLPIMATACLPACQGARNRSRT